MEKFRVHHHDLLNTNSCSSTISNSPYEYQKGTDRLLHLARIGKEFIPQWASKRQQTHSVEEYWYSNNKGLVIYSRDITLGYKGFGVVEG